MGELSSIWPTIHSHRRLLYVPLVLFILLIPFLSPRIRTATLGFQSQIVDANTAVAIPYTAVIIYLVNLYRSFELLESLATVNRNLPGHPWPIVLFHTGDYDHDSIRMDFLGQLINYIGAENGSVAFSERIEFVKLDWQLPEGISADIDVVNPVDPFRWPGELLIVVLIPHYLKLII
jgi:mannosyltransferase